jgi:hypothetical protein
MNKNEFKKYVVGSLDDVEITVIPLRSVIIGFARRSILILAVYFAFATVELYLHWYAGTQNTPTAHSLRTWYLQHEQYSGKTINGGSADFYTPATLLGLILGWILARHSRVELAFWVLFLSGGIVILYPLYVTLFPKGDLEWPDSIIKIIFGFTFKYMTILAVCGIFAFAARRLIRHFKHLDQSDAVA